MKVTANSSVKIATFGRWTAQKRGAFYIGRYASKPAIVLDIPFVVYP